jgi:alcohol dehydrogenase (cytochrome c)
VGLDADTWKERGAFYTIAPWEPGGNTWNALPDKRFAIRYGPPAATTRSNLAFFGPAPTYDTGPMRDPVAQPGVTNRAVHNPRSLDPDTGKLVQYFQHVPNDQWDFDWVFSASP